jgi:hypothetical protein
MRGQLGTKAGNYAHRDSVGFLGGTAHHLLEAKLIGLADAFPWQL